jgi:hypothetical protein
MYYCTVSDSCVRNELGLGVHSSLSMCGEMEEAERVTFRDLRLEIIESLIAGPSL